MVHGARNGLGRTLNESQLLLTIFKTNGFFVFFKCWHSLWSTPYGVHLFCPPWPTFQSSIFRLSIFTHYIIQFFKFLQILIDLCGQLSCAASNSLPCRDSNPGLPSMKQTAYQCATVIVLLDCINNLKDCLHNQKTL